jgi:hypothetical protein
VRENRTGIVRNNQGLDADSLNKTASGMNMLMSAAQQRQELIARVLAETPIKRLYRLIYRAIKRACAGVKTEPAPSADPAVAAAQAQIEIAKQSAAADAEIKRLKAEADIEIAQWKARQWAEIERFKVGLKAQLDEHELQHRTALKGLDIATANGQVPS